MADTASDSSAPSPMTDDELLELIARQEKAALGSPLAAGATVGDVSTNSQGAVTTLQIDRFNALNTYFGRPLGNEVEGSSRVVLPELRDTVEWIKPQLMRIFAAAKTPCVFDPEGEKDVDQAQVETETVNHVFMVQNDGFWVIYDLITDALLLRNGYTKVWWDDSERKVTETYTGLTEDQVAELLGDDQDEKIEILGYREYPTDMPPGALPPAFQEGKPAVQPQAVQQVVQQQPQQPQEGAAQPSSLNVFDIKLRRVTEKGRVRVECLPPEEVLPANGSSVSLDRTPFVEHGPTTKTRSELIAEGYDPKVVADLKPGEPNWMNIDGLARDQVTDEYNTEEQETYADKAMQKIEVRDVTLRVDFDGDGIAELRQVLVAGETILSNEEIEDVPIASAVSKRMPHRHPGISMYDELADLQAIKSQLAREALNSLRLANNPRVAVDWKRVNLADLMTTRAGGIVRVDGPPGESLEPFQMQSNLASTIVPMMEVVDKWREYRTGIGESSMMPDADSLQNVTAAGQLAGMASAGLKVELIARCLAEGLKDTFVKIRNLLVRHQDQAMQVRLRGKFVQVDPTTWRSSRTAVSPNVGLGSGNRPEARQNLLLLGNSMKEMGQFGLVGPKQAYNWFQRVAMMLGEDQPEQFVMDPSSEEYQQWLAQHPPQPNPAAIQAQSRVQTAQITAQSRVQTAQLQEQGAAARAQAEIGHAAIQGHEDRMVNMADIDSQVTQALLKILSGIVAKQYQGDPNANAGQVLRQDLGSLEGRS